MAVTQTIRDFKIDPKMLKDTMTRQAGTVEKAVLEGVMNSRDARASKIVISLVRNEGKAILTIEDDGCGIISKEDLIDHFETFGKERTKAEASIYGIYRMGRGQLFAFGENIWRTATFRMIVDINKGLYYILEEGLPFQEGCHITVNMYSDPIGNYIYPSMEKFEENLKKQVRYVGAPVYFNGKQLNVLPEECEWDIEDDNAYYLLNVGNELCLYNLGVYVMNLDISKYGSGGIIVSKNQLKVNSARNDVMWDCPVYQSIQEVVKSNLVKVVYKPRQVLTSMQRQATLSSFRDSTVSYDTIKLLSLIPTSQGKHMSFEAISRIKQQWCFAEHGSDLADKLMESGQCICFSDDVLYNLNYTGDKKRFFTWLTRNEDMETYGNDKWSHLERLYVDFHDVLENTSDEYLTFPENKMTVVERRVIKILNHYGSWNGRVINLGYSERANAWTDGRSYITINRSFLKHIYLGQDSDVNKLMMLLAHEMAHEEDTRGTHYHGPEFYENMVHILNGYHSPTILNANFHRRMIKGRYDEKRFRAEMKKEKAEKEMEKKLGISVK